jgi:hypothetical protein
VEEKELQVVENLPFLLLTSDWSTAENVIKIRLFVYLVFIHLPFLSASDGVGVTYHCSSGCVL